MFEQGLDCVIINQRKIKRMSRRVLNTAQMEDWSIDAVLFAVM